MDVAANRALELAFELAARNPQPWGDDAILTVAGRFHQFLTEGVLADTVIERLTDVETAIVTLETAFAALTAPKNKPPKPGPSHTEPVEF